MDPAAAIPSGLRVTAHALMANIALRRGDNESGMQRLEPAIAIIRAQPADLSLTDIADTRMLHANLLTESGRFAESEAELDWVLSAYRSLDQHHPVIGKTLAVKALNLQDQGMLARADAVFSEAIDQIMHSLGSNSLDMVQVRNNYSILLMQQLQPERAIGHIREAIRADGEARLVSSTSAYLKLRLARALIDTGELDEADQALGEARSLGQQFEIPRVIDQADFHQDYLDCLRGDGTGAHRLEERIPADADADIRARAVYQLGICLEALGDREAAHARFRQALEIAGAWPMPGSVEPLIAAIEQRLDKS